jgi:hypothetical protein
MLTLKYLSLPLVAIAIAMPGTAITSISAQQTTTPADPTAATAPAEEMAKPNEQI